MRSLKQLSTAAQDHLASSSVVQKPLRQLVRWPQIHGHVRLELRGLVRYPARNFLLLAASASRFLHSTPLNALTSLARCGMTFLHIREQYLSYRFPHLLAPVQIWTPGTFCMPNVPLLLLQRSNIPQTHDGSKRLPKLSPSL